MEEKVSTTRTYIHKAISLVVVMFATLPFIYSQMQSLQGLDKTSENFTVVKSTPGNLQFQFSQTTTPQIVFSRPLGIAEEDLKKYFSITPSTHGIWRLDRTKRIVYFLSHDITRDLFPTIFKPNTLYNIVIGKHLPSVDTSTLSEDVIITFKTRETTSPQTAGTY